MSTTIDLSTFKKGQSGVIQHLEHDVLTPKLVEMGLYVGNQVKVLFKAPFGDPIAVQVGDYVLSLRLEEAKLVVLEPLSL